MNRSAAAALGTLPIIACLVVTAAPAAHATVPGATRAAGISVSAALPNTLTVAGHRGRPVTVWTKGTAPITMRPLNSRPIRFGGLRTGRDYNVYVGAEKAATARTMTAAGRIIRATAVRGAVPSTLQVSWQHIAPSAVRPDAVRYLVTATSADGTIVRRIVRGVDTATLTGLDPKATYRVNVTPYLEGMRGTGTIADVSGGRVSTPTPTPAPGSAERPTGPTVPSGEPRLPEPEPVRPETPARPAPSTAMTPATPSTPVTPVTPASPVPASVPSTPAVPAVPAVPEPAPTPSIAPRTQLICPDGWTDNGTSCSQTSPYTYTTLSYTYHVGVVGQQSIGECWIRNSVTGVIERFADCREPVYGNVKDATPSGYEDTGTQWQRKDAPPAGWTDNGASYERTTAKIEVPA